MSKVETKAIPRAQKQELIHNLFSEALVSTVTNKRELVMLKDIIALTFAIKITSNSATVDFDGNFKIKLVCDSEIIEIPSRLVNLLATKYQDGKKPNLTQIGIGLTDTWYFNLPLMIPKGMFDNIHLYIENTLSAAEMASGNISISQIYGKLPRNDEFITIIALEKTFVGTEDFNTPNGETLIDIYIINATKTDDYIDKIQLKDGTQYLYDFFKEDLKAIMQKDMKGADFENEEDELLLTLNPPIPTHSNQSLRLLMTTSETIHVYYLVRKKLK